MEPSIRRIYVMFTQVQAWKARKAKSSPSWLASWPISRTHRLSKMTLIFALIIANGEDLPSHIPTPAILRDEPNQSPPPSPRRTYTQLKCSRPPPCAAQRGATIVDEYVLCSDARGLVYVPENQAVNNVKRNILSSFKKYEIYLHFRALDWIFFWKEYFLLNQNLNLEWIFQSNFFKNM